MRQKNTRAEKESAVQKPPKRGRLVKAAEAKERSNVTAEEILSAAMDLRAGVRRGLSQIEASIKKFVEAVGRQ